MATKTKSRPRSGAPGDAPPIVSYLRRILLLGLLFTWAFVLLSLIGFSPADPPSHAIFPPNDPVHNWCGPVGSHLAYALFRLLGAGVWVLILVPGLILLNLATGALVTHPVVRSLGVIMLSGAVSGFQALAFSNSGPFPDLAGGVLGTVGVEQLSLRFGSVGTGVVLGALAFLGAIVAMDDWLGWAFGWSWRWMRETGAPAAAVAGAATASVTKKVATDLAAPAAVSAAKATARAGTGFFSGLRSLFSRTTPPVVREHDLDDTNIPGGPAALISEPKPALRKGKKPTDPAAVPAAMFPGESDGSLAVSESRARLAEFGLIDDEADELDDELARVERAPIPVSKNGKPISSAAVTSAPAEFTPADADDEEDHDLPGAPQVFDKDALREKIARLPLALGQNNKLLATEESLRDVQAHDPMEGYRFPGLDLLENPEENFNARLEEYVREQAAALESALRQYRIDGEVVGIESGPVITLYDVRLAPGTKVAAISAVSSDIARALKAINIRIVPNQVGRDTVGIEVPNATKEKVRLKELMSKSDVFAKMKLPVFLGKDASGEPLISDLTQMPHMLIAGTTGSGKSVCMNTIIMGFLYTKKPNELKLVLVDPKMVEMSQFKDIPHLMCPVVTEMSKAAAILEWACGKMDERYELLAEAGCRDIAGYNDLSWDELKERFNPKSPEEEARIPRKLPYMVFIIDELADLMMTAKEVESFIIRIAQKARAVGIHLILATQRPQATVVTGLIKGNMPCRISFKVASGLDSRIVLDQKGGELLLGHGDMLFLSPRSNKLTRAQGTLVDDTEIRRVVRFMRDVASPSFERQLLVLREPSQDGTGLANLADEDRLLQSKNNSSASLKAAQEDPLFERAVEIVLETRRGSVSLLQRRLAIGYTRSSRLIDLMGIAGIISDHKGSVARDVLITPEEWELMKQMAAEEAREKGISWPPRPPEQGQLFAGGTPPAADADAGDGSADAQGAESAEAEYEQDYDDAPENEVGEGEAADDEDESGKSEAA